MSHFKTLSLVAVGLMMAAGSAGAEAIADHAELKGPFETPMDVTKACLECHDSAAEEIMKTSHWTWTMEQEVPGKGKEVRGKANVFNNFCISLRPNWPRCTSCHIGYGWKDDSFDFTDATRVDCLSCHDTTGTYNKGKGAPAGAGMPPGYTGKKKFDKDPVDLVKVAQSAGKTPRNGCLNCHAYGGGGNNVKHGDIDASLYKPSDAVDIHMGETNDMTCSACHETNAHDMKGNSLIVSPGGKNKVACVDCHDAEPHSETMLNSHTAKVACQTCHIPEFAKEYPTKMSWDWSQAKNPKDLPEDQRVIKEHGHPVYLFNKGKFVYEQHVKPSYAWHNGTMGAYSLGDKMDPSKETMLNYPMASMKDKDAKIYPFKIHKAKQPYDKKNMYLVAPKVFGGKDDPDAFWVNFDWQKASIAGMKAVGLDYSGELGFAPTITYWGTNHMVSPASEALGCLDCHGDQGRLNWKALGYKGDPMRMKLAGK